MREDDGSNRQKNTEKALFTVVRLIKADTITATSAKLHLTGRYLPQMDEWEHSFVVHNA